LLLGTIAILFIGFRYNFAFLSELVTGVLGIFFVFSLWCLASTLWSVEVSGTLYKSWEYCVMLALFALTASLIRSIFREPGNQLLALKSVFDWNWLLLFLLLVSVYVGLLAWPEYGIARGWEGQPMGLLGFAITGAFPAIASNGVGQLGAILGIVALVRILLKPRAEIVYMLLFMLCLLTLVLAQSRSAILGFSVAVVAVLLADRRFKLLLTLSAGSACAILVLGYGPTIYEFLMRGQDEQQFGTLTGRTEAWEVSFKAISENWLTGYGANVGGRHIMQSALGYGWSSVHSTYVETLLDTGLVGITLLLVGLGATWYWLFRVRSYVVRNLVGRLLWFESLGVLCVLSIRSVFTLTFVWTDAVLVFGLVLTFVTITRGYVGQRHHASIPFAQPIPAARWRRPSLHD
jgi:O-antigen ligase